MLISRGDALKERHSRARVKTDLENAVLCYQSTLRQVNSPNMVRIAAGKKVLPLHENTADWQQAYKDCSIALHLVPKLSSRSLKNSDKQYLLRLVVGLACDATAVALQAEEAPLNAIKLLEQGRGVLAASLEEIRIDLYNLQNIHPELADEFVRLRDELEPPITRNTFFADKSHESLVQARVGRRYNTGKELNQLIDEIHKRPQFEDFLLPPNEKKIQAAAKCGPIVMINVSVYRCDALLIKQDQIWSLALPHLNNKEIKEKARSGDLGSSRILEWRWEVVANPILDALGFTGPPFLRSPQRLPACHKCLSKNKAPT